MLVKLRSIWCVVGLLVYLVLCAALHDVVVRHVGGVVGKRAYCSWLINRMRVLRRGVIRCAREGGAKFKMCRRDILW